MKFLELKRLLSEEEIVPPSKDGGSFKKFWKMLYHIRLLKYVRQSQLTQIDPLYSKICSREKLCRLSELGLLINTTSDIFIATDEVIKHLDYIGEFNVNLLPEQSKGLGDINQLNNTEVFIQALKLPDFCALLYPNFGYLVPDGLLVRRRKDSYKLGFLEVEASKTLWDDWLENKKSNYLKLASCKDAFDYWKGICNSLNIPQPNIKDFKFSVNIVGKVKKDFGIGFNFVERL